MTRFTILALTIIAASLATQISAQAADAKAQGNRPQSSQIDGTLNLFRLVVAQGEVSSLRQSLQVSTLKTQQVHIEEELPDVVDFSNAPSEMWHVRPAVQNALRGVE